MADLCRRESIVVNMDTNRIISILTQQADHYERLLKLADAQHEFVVQDRHDELLEVLTRRQIELDAITTLEREVRELKNQWMEISQSLDADDRTKIEQLFHTTRDLLERITESDQNDALVLQQRKLSVGRQIHHANSAGVAHQRYAAGAYAKPSSVNLAR